MLQQPEWSVLVYDKPCKQIITPLLKLKDLRELNVTLTYQLEMEQKEPIEDAVGIYFLSPSDQSLQFLVRDVQAQIFQSYYIHFSSSISSQQLQSLAQALQNDYHRVKMITDQYLNFVSLEQNMISCGLTDSYAVLNGANEVDIIGMISQIVIQLFCVVVTSGCMPVIKSSRGGAAEVIGQQLSTKLRDYSRTATLGKRSLLVILDRQLDLGVMLHHTWSYQCLVHDVLQLEANRVSFDGKVFDFDVDDYFWTKNAAQPFPVMAEDVDIELSKYKKETEDITRSCGVDSLDQIDPTQASQFNSSLKSAITQLPALTQKKRTIDMHMNIASQLLKKIKQRSLDQFIVTEENLQKLTRVQLQDLIKSDQGTVEDKLRLYLVYMLSPYFENSLETETLILEKGADPKVVKYIKSIKNFTKLTAAVQPQVSQVQKQFMNRLSSVRDSGFGGAIDTLISGVKNILPANTKLPITRVVESILQSDSEEYTYHDPLQKPQSQVKKRLQYDQVFVFVAGSGNYVEYQNLQEFGKSVGKTIIYGSSEVCNSQEFLKQLTKM